MKCRNASHPYECTPTHFCALSLIRTNLIARELRWSSRQSIARLLSVRTQDNHCLEGGAFCLRRSGSPRNGQTVRCPARGKLTQFPTSSLIGIDTTSTLIASALIPLVSPQIRDLETDGTAARSSTLHMVKNVVTQECRSKRCLVFSPLAPFLWHSEVRVGLSKEWGQRNGT